MTIKQSSGATVWTEPPHSGAAPTVLEVGLISDGTGNGYTIQELNGGQPDARYLSDGAGGFVLTPGSGNPGNLAELHLLQMGATRNIITYE
jgi:hypothetical protein